MMTRKDFEAIAAVFRDHRAMLVNTPVKDSTDTFVNMELRHAHAELASNLAKALAETNPRFDCQRFIEACGVK